MLTKQEFTNLLIDASVGIADAMRRMSDGGAKSLIVIGEDNQLLGVLSDGNVRRHITAIGSIGGTVEDCYNRDPFVHQSGNSEEELRHLMLSKKLEMVPVVDSANRVIGVYTWDRIFSDEPAVYEPVDCHAVVMAGGQGSRLDPFTRVLPKPLIPIGDTTVIELIMSGLAKHGIREFFVTINHKAILLKAYFQERTTPFSIRWIEEEEPLGTAGSLAYLDGTVDRTLLVTNCDTIIKHPINEILDHHKTKEADITIVAAAHRFVVPYGVCQTSDDGMLINVSEKPSFDLMVNTGMYMAEPSVLSRIPRGKRMDFPELMESVRESGGRVGVFSIANDTWNDVGQWAEYRKTVEALA